MGRGGFEPPKSVTADLQSAPFGHSGTYPYEVCGAGDGTRTRNLLITNQLLCQLSYASTKLVCVQVLGESGDPEGARTLDLQRDRLAL